MKQELRGDILNVPSEATVDVSVICPFYNEEQIIGTAISALLTRLEEHLDTAWELIVVNDGSTDRSAEIAAEMAKNHSRLRLVGYTFNRGRGHALRAGIAQARGKVIVTTEIDLSWGEDIVERLVQALVDNPDIDIVIASPHLSGGGYKNVPAKRVLLSRLGNRIIRACMSNAATMNTGMTRAYHRDVIKTLPLEEDGKEFHLEVVLKAQALNYRIMEIPAILEWKEYKHQEQRVKRKSSSKINKLVVTHSLFSLFANPIRYVWGLSAATIITSTGFLIWGMLRFAAGEVSVYALIISLVLAVISVMLFGFGVIAQQGNMMQCEIWRLRQNLALRETRISGITTAQTSNAPAVSEEQLVYLATGTKSNAQR